VLINYNFAPGIHARTIPAIVSKELNLTIGKIHSKYLKKSYWKNEEMP
jgi:hypothetical protein